MSAPANSHARTKAASSGIQERLDALFRAEAERVEAGGLPAHMSQAEIAAQIGTTKQYVQLIERDAFKKVRKLLAAVAREHFGERVREGMEARRRYA